MNYFMFVYILSIYKDYYRVSLGSPTFIKFLYHNQIVTLVHIHARLSLDRIFWSTYVSLDLSTPTEMRYILRPWLKMKIQ